MPPVRGNGARSTPRPTSRLVKSARRRSSAGGTCLNPDTQSLELGAPGTQSRDRRGASVNRSLTISASHFPGGYRLRSTASLQRSVQNSLLLELPDLAGIQAEDLSQYVGVVLAQ